MKTYKFDRFWLLAGLLLMSACVPLASIHEIITTGTIDMDAVGRGRAEIPVWILYLITWPVFLYFCVLFFLPAFGAIIRGYVFKCDGETLIVKGVAIEKLAIRSYEFTLVKGTCLSTENGGVSFHPGLSSKGNEIMEDFLQGIPRE